MTPPFASSLCHQCAARRLIPGRNSSFIMCTALPEKYPRQPVVACPAFRPALKPWPVHDNRASAPGDPTDE
jgi:hypothetical protein